VAAYEELCAAPRRRAYGVPARAWRIAYRSRRSPGLGFDVADRGKGRAGDHRAHSPRAIPLAGASRLDRGRYLGKVRRRRCAGTLLTRINRPTRRNRRYRGGLGGMADQVRAHRRAATRQPGHSYAASKASERGHTTRAGKQSLWTTAALNLRRCIFSRPLPATSVSRSSATGAHSTTQRYAKKVWLHPAA